MARCRCRERDGEAFEGAEEDWSGKAFYVVGTPLAFHIPLRIGRDIEKAVSEAEAKGYTVDDDSRLLQKDALFKGQVLLEIRDPQEGDPRVFIMAQETRAEGTFFNGPWSRLGTPTKKLVDTLVARGKTVKDIYFWYLTCPVCAKERGYQTVVWATY